LQSGNSSQISGGVTSPCTAEGQDFRNKGIQLHAPFLTAHLRHRVRGDEDVPIAAERSTMEKPSATYVAKKTKKLCDLCDVAVNTN